MMKIYSLIVLAVLTGVCSLPAFFQDQTAKPKPNANAAASPGPNSREEVYYTITLTNASAGDARRSSKRRAPKSESKNPAVSGRVTGVAADPGPTNNKTANLNQPDLMIKQFLFPPNNEKALRVQIINQGNADAAACRLVLTIRKINGAAVGRQTHVNVPALASGKTAWLVVDAKSILPINVSLEATTFKLNVDATGIVAESDEANNEVWHNQ